MHDHQRRHKSAIKWIQPTLTKYGRLSDCFQLSSLPSPHTPILHELAMQCVRHDLQVSSYQSHLLLFPSPTPSPLPRSWLVRSSAAARGWNSTEGFSNCPLKVTKNINPCPRRRGGLWYQVEKYMDFFGIFPSGQRNQKTIFENHLKHSEIFPQSMS